MENTSMFPEMLDKLSRPLLKCEKDIELFNCLQDACKNIREYLLPNKKYLEILKLCAQLAPRMQSYLEAFDFHNSDDTDKDNRIYFCIKFYCLSNIVADINALQCG